MFGTYLFVILLIIAAYSSEAAGIPIICFALSFIVLRLWDIDEKLSILASNTYVIIPKKNETTKETSSCLKCDNEMTTNTCNKCGWTWEK
jgi:hypothetical protein